MCPEGVVVQKVQSSGKVFVRCQDCGGWGEGLVGSSGFCGFCERKRGVSGSVRVVGSQSIGGQSVGGQSVGSQSVANQPIRSQPATNQPATNQPATNQPTTNQPATNQLTHTQHTHNVHSHASEILGMQPQLRMYKKRPGPPYSHYSLVESNIPLSRRTKQTWEKGNVDPLALGDDKDAQRFRKRYRDCSVCNKQPNCAGTWSGRREASP